MRKANAHFSDDLLSSLLNEPLVGQGVFWSSVKGNAYPVPLRILSFERMHKTRDPGYSLGPVENYATKLRDSAPLTSAAPPTAAAMAKATVSAIAPPAVSGDEDGPDISVTHQDTLRADTESSVAAVEQDAEVRQKILQGDGIPWFVVMRKIEAMLPESLRQDKNRINRLVASAVSKIVCGQQDKAWATERRDGKSGKSTLYIIRR